MVYNTSIMTTFARINFAPTPKATNPYVLEAQRLFHAAPDQREAAIMGRVNSVPEELRPAADMIAAVAIGAVNSQISISNAPHLLRGLDLLSGVDLMVDEAQTAIDFE